MQGGPLVRRVGEIWGGVLGMIRIVVPGRAVAQSRPRLTTRGGRPHAYEDARSRVYKDFVRECAFDQYRGEPLSGPVALGVEELRVVPKSWPASRREAALLGHDSEWPGKPDIDNVVKAIMDALTGVAWADDAQVVRLDASKRYGLEDCVEITVGPVV